MLTDNPKEKEEIQDDSQESIAGRLTGIIL